MNREDQELLKLGKEVLRMIRDLARAVNPASEAGYARRTLTFTGGKVEMILTNDPQLADAFERAIEDTHSVKATTPHSERN